MDGANCHNTYRDDFDDHINYLTFIFSCFGDDDFWPLVFNNLICFKIIVPHYFWLVFYYHNSQWYLFVPFLGQVETIFITKQTVQCKANIAMSHFVLSLGKHFTATECMYDILLSPLILHIVLSMVWYTLLLRYSYVSLFLLSHYYIFSSTFQVTVLQPFLRSFMLFQSLRCSFKLSMQLYIQ